MDIVRFREAQAFLDVTFGLLSAEVVRNQVLLGVAAMAADQPHVYPDYEAFVVFDGGVPVVAAAQTAPYNFIMSHGGNQGAVRLLSSAIAGSGLEVPGILGNLPLIGEFVRAWDRLTGTTSMEVLRQGVFSLEHVEDLVVTPGQMRDATKDDRTMLIEWWDAFNAEALPDDAHGARSSSVAERVDLRLDPERGQGVSLWVADDRVVSMSGYSSPVADSVRIGPVYTPPDLRGRGFATALVAGQSRRFLAEGQDRCLLHTDLANPTSNAIYERIGYRKVAEAAEYRFASGSVSGSERAVTVTR